MAIDALTRACICHALIQDPGATVCEKCSRVLVPHHSQWPPVLRWWLLAELAGTRFLPWKAAQEVWEELLKDSLNGVRAGSNKPNPNGPRITMTTPVADLFAIALERAAEWKSNGSHVGPIIEPARRTA